MFDQAALHRVADEDHDRNGKDDRQRHGPIDDRRPHLIAKPCLYIGNIDLKGVAQKVGFGFVNDRVTPRENARQCHRAESSDHEQRTMRKIDNAQRAENKRETQRDKRIGRALV